MNKGSMNLCFIRCRLKEISKNNLFVLEKCTDNRSIKCKRPRWLVHASLGDEFIVRFGNKSSPSILCTLSTGKPQPEKFHSQKEWVDRTHLKARAIGHNIATSIDVCKEHRQCQSIGFHVIDVASFFNARLNEECNIINKIRESTGSNWIGRGFVVNNETPCISFFLHTSLDYSQIIIPESSIVKIRKWIDYDSDFSLNQKYDPGFDWYSLFKYAWDYRVSICQSFPEYAFFNTWVLQNKQQRYKANWFVQTCVRLVSIKAREFLQTKKIPFNCRCIKLEITEEFQSNHMNMLKYSTSLQAYYRHLKGKQLEFIKIDKNPRVIVFENVWEIVMNSVNNRNIMHCCSLLAGYHLHPFLVEATRHLHMVKWLSKSIELSDPEKMNRTSYDHVFVDLTQPLKQLDNILTQKLIIHGLTSENKMISEQSIEVNRWKHPSIEFIEPISNGWSTEHLNHLESKLGVYSDASGVCTVDFVKSSKALHVHLNDLTCFEIEGSHWKNMQQKLSHIATEFPFDGGRVNELFNSVKEADKTKNKVKSYRILSDKTLEENIYQGKPVIVQWCHEKPKKEPEAAEDGANTAQNPWMQIITLSIPQNIHKCFIHLDYFQRAYPGYELPNGWLNRCSSAKYYSGIRMSSTDREGLYKIDGRGYPQSKKYNYICITACVVRDRKGLVPKYVFYAHGEHVRKSNDPETSYFLLHTMLACGEDVLTSANLTLQFI